MATRRVQLISTDCCFRTECCLHRGGVVLFCISSVLFFIVMSEWVWVCADDDGHHFIIKVVNLCWVGGKSYQNKAQQSRMEQCDAFYFYSIK